MTVTYAGEFLQSLNNALSQNAEASTIFGTLTALTNFEIDQSIINDAQQLKINCLWSTINSLNTLLFGISQVASDDGCYNINYVSSYAQP